MGEGQAEEEDEEGVVSLGGGKSSWHIATGGK